MKLILAYPRMTDLIISTSHCQSVLITNAADNAWHNTNGNPVTRFAQVLQEIVDGIDANT